MAMALPQRHYAVLRPDGTLHYLGGDLHLIHYYATQPGHQFLLIDYTPVGTPTDLLPADFAPRTAPAP